MLMYCPEKTGEAIGSFQLQTALFVAVRTFAQWLGSKQRIESSRGRSTDLLAQGKRQSPGRGRFRIIVERDRKALVPPGPPRYG